jgi:predicted ATPase
MLRALFLRNFKCFDDQGATLELAPITLILGPNSAGKSTCFQALVALRQTWEAAGQAFSQLGHLDLVGPRTSLGNYRNVVHGHDARREVEIGIKADSGWARFIYHSTPELPQARLVRMVLEARSIGALALSVGDRHQNSLELRFDPRGVARIQGLDIQIQRDLECLVPQAGRADLVLALRHSEFRLFLDTADRSDSLGRIEKAMKEASGTLWRQLKRLLEVTLFAVRDEVLSLAHVGASRTPCGRVAEVNPRPSAQEFDSRGEQLPSLLAFQPELVSLVNRALKRLEQPYTLSVNTTTALTTTMTEVVLSRTVVSNAADGDEAVPSDEGQWSLAVDDVGYGIGQLLPLLVEHARLSREPELRAPPRLLLVEQPELHLHPKLHADLVSVLANARTPGECDDSSTAPQVIAETHSEHMVLRLQKHVRRGELKPEDISLVFVEQRDSGSSAVTPIALDDQGRFRQRWPYGFFPERQKERE